MWREDDVVQAVVLRRVGRLFRMGIEPGAVDGSPTKRVEQGRLIDQLATAGVDEDRRGPHPPELLGVDHASRLVGGRQMQGDEVGRLQ